MRKHKSRKRKPFLVCSNIFHDAPAFFCLNKLFSCSANIYLVARTFSKKRKPTAQTFFMWHKHFSCVRSLDGNLFCFRFQPHDAASPWRRIISVYVCLFPHLKNQINGDKMPLLSSFCNHGGSFRRMNTEQGHPRAAVGRGHNPDTV